jgi:hypothetical protein
MKAYQYLLVVCCVALFWCAHSELWAQRFPEDWSGTWKGKLEIFQKSKVVQRIDLTLTIAPTDTAGRWKWQIQYQGQDVRDYRLIATPDTAQGKWVIDEQDGIILDLQRNGNVLTSIFEVDSLWLVVREELVSQDILTMEFATYELTNARASGASGPGIPPVNSFPVQSYQRGILRRQ